MAKYSYDLLVIGGGPGGSGAASTAAAEGRRVALIERDKLGGTCLNYGCDPTKTLLHAAQLLQQARDAATLGLRFGRSSADWAALHTRVQRVQNQVRGGSDAQARKQQQRDGIDAFKGTARFIGPHELQVNKHILQADQIVIATGGEAVLPPIDGLEQAGYLTNKEALGLKELPQRLAIIGGGPIGAEFAQMFQRLGTKVTLLEQGPVLLEKDDRELADQLCALLKAEGIRIETNVEVVSVRRGPARPHGRVTRQLALKCSGGSHEQLTVDAILVAIGFKPAIDALNLAAAGVAIEDGAIKVDPMLRTNVPHIWAVGDVLGGYQFTHVAYEQGRLTARNAYAKHPQPFGDRPIPWVTYTSPELAHVGQTEEQLRQAGIHYHVGKKPMAEVERAVAISQTDGLVKLLVGDDGRLLGAHILAANAGELIAPATLAMRAGLTAEVLASTILPYPTMAEGLRWAAEDAQKACSLPK